MPNALVAAAATGLPMSRRLFLGRASTTAVAASLAAAALPASAAAPAIATALATALTADRDSEEPELLQIGLDLAAAKQRFEDALTALTEAQERALPLEPPVPDGLPVPSSISIFGQLDWFSLPQPTNILGDPIELPRFVSPKTGREFPVRVPRSFDILADRRKRGRLTGIASWERGEHRRLYDLAVRFELEMDTARETSGLTAAEIKLLSAGSALVNLCRSANAIQPRTIAGIIIQAQAIDACADVPSESSRCVVYSGSRSLPFALCDVLAVQ